MVRLVEREQTKYLFLQLFVFRYDNDSGKQPGVLWYVSTSNLLVAKFFLSLNDGTNEKPAHSNLWLIMKNNTCQESVDGPKKSVWNSSHSGPHNKKLEIRNEILRTLAHEASL